MLANHNPMESGEKFEQKSVGSIQLVCSNPSFGKPWDTKMDQRMLFKPFRKPQ